MQRIQFAGLFLFALTCSAVTLHGQHDPHRNAIRHIAAGDLKKASTELKKANPDDPETKFVEMVALLKLGDVPAAGDKARDTLNAGLPFERLLVGPRKALTPLYESDAWKALSDQHGDGVLLHGPMLGTVTEDGASFWVRTSRPATLKIDVFEADAATVIRSSPPRNTTARQDFTTILRVEGLRPRTSYRYEVLIGDQKMVVENARFTTHPKQGDSATFHVAFGGGAGYVPEWERMWDTIEKLRPNAFLTLGDNVYIDDPTQPLTNHYCYYRRQSRPEWRRLIASTSVYSIYDDHDFGMNDCVPGPEIESPPWKRTVWNTFRENWVNPYYGGGERQPGCWYDFYIGDVHFIMLDGRYYRTRKPQPSMLGPVQKAWLLETLKNSRGTFKVLASPVPWTEGIKPGSRDPWDGFPDEREEIFSHLEANRINGVFLIAADRHRTDLRITKRRQSYDLYEFESSKLTNRHTHPVVKTDTLVWGYNKTCSFGLIRFDTTKPDPQVRFEAITIDGEKVHEFELKLSQLQHRD
ncbi:MAG: alkaline phosphatase D family protein [Planctomycetes bacterium]|nr:alkaline phosphatase D family protein [Planctomycetota bacterium]